MSFRNRRILITGISGFAGSYLARHLIKQGADVYGLYRQRADGIPPFNLHRLNIINSITLCEGDLLNMRSVVSAVKRSNPEYIFHLGAQSFVQRSFICPTETMDVNCRGTGHLLDAVKCQDIDPVIVYAGSSEEYGLVIYSQKQYHRLVQKYGVVFPAPVKIPEVPVTEENPLRPMSPYAVSKIYGDHLMRNFHNSFGLRTVVSRAFNHEGAGRGSMFVTSSITRQVMQLKCGAIDRITIGNVNTFRDWSHVNDIVNGYCLLAEKGIYGDVYNQGSERTNSVLSYLLLALECAGYSVEKVQTIKGRKVIENPTASDSRSLFGLHFEKTRADRMLLEGKVEYTIADRGLTVFTGNGNINIVFDPDLFRPADVPILLASTGKIKRLGFKTKYLLKDVINDQLAYYRDRLH